MSDLNELYFTRESAASFLGVDKCTLTRWFSEGIGPPRIKLGSRVLYSKKSILEWLDSKEVKPCRE